MREDLVGWFAKAGRDLPWRHNRHPYAVLVSEIMLQQTQVVTVIDYFRRWMIRFPDFCSLAQAPESEVLHAWQGLGYYSRARNLHKAAKRIVEAHGGEMPRDLPLIQALPGLGRYTAGAVATFAFDQSTPIVDANIARVLARLENYLLPVDSAEGQKWLWHFAGNLQPERGAGVFNEALMELGALICLPRAPKCPECPIRSYCKAKEPMQIPVKKAGARTVELQENCGWIIQNGQVLLEKQTGPRWHGLWKLPLLEEKADSLGKPLLRMEYPFTNHRIRLSVYPSRVPKQLGPNQQWFAWEELDQVAITAPHRRAIERCRGGCDNRLSKANG